MKVQKDGIIKEIEDERLAADYISAGWKKVEEIVIKAKAKKSKGFLKNV